MAMVHTPDTVKAQIQADIAASNAKTGATDTTLHDAVNRLIDGFGAGTGGITPTGTKEITSNGTYDVTNYAQALVNVSSASGEQISVLRNITIDSDQGAGTATLLTVLSADEFIKANYSKNSLSITMVNLGTASNVSGIVDFIYHGNRVISDGKGKICGLAVQSGGTGSYSNIALNTAPLTGKTYNVGFRIDSSGNVILYTRAANTIRAGSYLLILTCTD